MTKGQLTSAFSQRRSFIFATFLCSFAT